MIISALYRARRPGAVTVRAIERAWAVLALKAPEFANVDDRIFQLVRHSKYSHSEYSHGKYSHDKYSIFQLVSIHCRVSPLR